MAKATGRPKRRWIVEAGGVWAYCNKCSDLTQFDGDKCKKCETVKA